MNLLLTNVREDTAFLLIRYLRREADKIVLAVDGDSLTSRWTGMARYSRHVTASHRVPDPAADWWAGKIQATNTPAEEAYIRRIESICKDERIDVIFPSFDPEMYVFAKNRARFNAAGITVVVPPLASVLAVQDKSTVLQAAASTGFPHPVTCYPESIADLAGVIARIEPPWVLKPRFSAHGTDLELACTALELETAFKRMAQKQSSPLVQEFIPGGLKQNFYMVVDNDSSMVSVFAPRVTRVRRDGVRTATAACIWEGTVPFLTEVQALVRSLSLAGGFTLQTQIDGRDGIPKLMEINPRLGHNLWFRAESGVPEPAILIRLARGQQPGPVPDFVQGRLLLDPLIDSMHLLRQIRRHLAATFSRKQAPEAGDRLAGDPIRWLVGSYRQDYLGPGKIITSPLNRGYLDDPLPPLSRIARQLVALLKPDPGQLR